MRMSDYLINRIYDAGVKHVFFVPGTGCMFLTDALARKTELTAVSMHHEQAAGMAALTYAKCNEELGACIVTTGCGGTNAITALLHAWQDSVPCVFISGQAARNQTVHNSNVSLRQMGRQEADIIALVKPISKYAVMINNPDEVVYEIDKALHIARTGRKGPVWLDIPMDIQNCMVDEEKSNRFVPDLVKKPVITENDVEFVLSSIDKSDRPVLIIGNGVRLSGAINELKIFAEKFNLPITYSRLGHDLIDTDHPLSIGMIGMLGATRAGNFAVANSDLLISIGSRLSVNTTGYEYDKFAREAQRIVIDIDRDEHSKNTIRIDHFIHSDAKSFFEVLNQRTPVNLHKNWQEKCLYWKITYPANICNKENNNNDERINMYNFVDALSYGLPLNATILSDAGNSVFIVPASIKIKENQRSITSGAQAEMGYSLPAAIGAAFACEGIITAITGDGSIMMNLQELQTLSTRNLPVKLFIMNNNGYSSIRFMQKTSFRRLIGCDSQSGIDFPDFEKIANSFNLSYVRINNNNELNEKIKNVIKMDGPVVCEVMCVSDQNFLSVSAAMNSKKRLVNRPLEDQSPFLDRDLFLKEMIIEPLD